MNIRLMLAALAMLSLAAHSADAHAQLRSASPAVGSTVSAAPTELAINFSEGVEPKFSSIEVRDAAGAQVDRADPHTAPGVQTRLIVSLNALKPGVYEVSWAATSVDTHHTQGKFSFTVAP